LHATLHSLARPELPLAAWERSWNPDGRKNPYVLRAMEWKINYHGCPGGDPRWQLLIKKP